MDLSIQPLGESFLKFAHLDAAAVHCRYHGHTILLLSWIGKIEAKWLPCRCSLRVAVTYPWDSPVCRRTATSNIVSSRSENTQKPSSKCCPITACHGMCTLAPRTLVYLP